jgi:hypothetical protein
MKAPKTRDKYRGRIAKFFDFIGLNEGTMEEHAKIFTERGDDKLTGAEKKGILITFWSHGMTYA